MKKVVLALGFSFFTSQVLASTIILDSGESRRFGSTLVSCQPTVAGDSSRCSLGKTSYGNPTIIVDGSMFQSYTSSEQALNALVAIKNAGICSTANSKCGLGKTSYGNPTVIVNGSVFQSYNSSAEAIAAVSQIADSGLCQ